MTTTKISFKVPPFLWERFAAQTTALFIARGPLLNHMILRELPHLQADLGGRKLSKRANRHISGQLQKQGAKSVNIAVDIRAAHELRAIADDHNMVRDAFLCRLIIMLRGTPALLKVLGVPTRPTGMDLQGLEAAATSPLTAIEDALVDPFFYLRHFIDQKHGCGIYSVNLPRDCDWAACYLDEEDVPVRVASKRSKVLELLMASDGVSTSRSDK